MDPIITEMAASAVAGGLFQGVSEVFKLEQGLIVSLRDTAIANSVATFTKYPLRAVDVRSSSPPYKKNGVFLSEYKYLKEILTATELIPLTNGYGWCRHPLTYLMETADDLCNMTVDFEDGFRLRHLSYEFVKQGFLDIINEEQDQAKRTLDWLTDDISRVVYLRAIAIGKLVRQISDAYELHEDSILRGEPIGDLISKTPAGAKKGPIQRIKDQLVEKFSLQKKSSKRKQQVSKSSATCLICSPVRFIKSRKMKTRVLNQKNHNADSFRISRGRQNPRQGSV